MRDQIPLTIVIGVSNVDIALITPELWQLSHQTVSPLEVLVVCGSPDDQYRRDLHAACAEFAPLVRVIDAPQYHNQTDPEYGYGFSCSHASNVGIKQSSPESKFICFQASGLLISQGAVEAIGETMSSDALCEVRMAALGNDYEINPVETLWQRWDEMIERLDSYSRTLTFVTGSLMCASRDWFFKIHGFDETNYPMAYSDSDIHRRARLDGLKLKIIPWEKLQMIHVAHPRRYRLPPYPSGQETNIVANGDQWGEIEAIR